MNSVPQMMYGFGDDKHPREDTVDCIEDLLVEFVLEVTRMSLEVGKSTAERLDKLRMEDVMFVLRKDPKKVDRILELEVAFIRTKEARSVTSGKQAATAAELAAAELSAEASQAAALEEEYERMERMEEERAQLEQKRILEQEADRYNLEQLLGQAPAAGASLPPAEAVSALPLRRPASVEEKARDEFDEF